MEIRGQLVKKNLKCGENVRHREVIKGILTEVAFFAFFAFLRRVF